MFNLDSFINLLNIISTIGFLISGITGIITVTNAYNLPRLLISINSIILFNILIYLEFLNYKKQITKFMIIRGIIFIFYGILLLDINVIGCAFGIFSIIVGISNILFNYFNYSKKFHLININASLDQNYTMMNEKFINDVTYCEN